MEIVCILLLRLGYWHNLLVFLQKLHCVCSDLGSSLHHLLRRSSCLWFVSEHQEDGYLHDFGQYYTDCCFCLFAVVLYSSTLHCDSGHDRSFLLAVGAVPVAYNHLEGGTPTHVKVICGILILAAVVGMAVMGYILKVANNFAIFSFVMAAIYIVLFVIASALFY